MHRRGIVGSSGRTIFSFLRNCQIVFQSDLTSLQSHQQGRSVPLSPHSCRLLLLPEFLISWLVWGGISGLFWFTFPWWLRMLNISLGVSQPFEIPQLRILYLALYPIFWFTRTPFLIGLLGSLESKFLSSLYILDTSPLLDVELVKIFSQSVDCHFVLLIVSFALQKLFNFMKSHLLIIDLRAWVTGVLFRKFSPVPLCSRLFPTFSSISFSRSGFMWRSLIHLDLNFVQGVRMDQFAFFYMLTASWTSTFCWKCSFFHWMFCQRSSDHRYVGLFLGLQFYSIDLPVCPCPNNMWFLSLLLLLYNYKKKKLSFSPTMSCTMAAAQCL